MPNFFFTNKKVMVTVSAVEMWREMKVVLLAVMTGKPLLKQLTNLRAFPKSTSGLSPVLNPVFPTERSGASHSVLP